MFKFLNEFDKKYSSVIVVLSLFVIIIFLFFNSRISNGNGLECKVPKEIVNNVNNYSYNIKVTNNETSVELFIKRYNSKYLIEKNEFGIKSTYYINYTDILEKASNGKYIKYRKNDIVEGLDNKFLIFDYVNDISLKSTVLDDNGITCFNNRQLELSICMNLDETITLKMSNYVITYQINNIGSIKDFNVDVNYNYKDDDYNSELENNSNDIFNNNIAQ